jgi:hypothetical protein
MMNRHIADNPNEIKRCYLGFAFFDNIANIAINGSAYEPLFTRCWHSAA